MANAQAKNIADDIFGSDSEDEVQEPIQNQQTGPEAEPEAELEAGDVEPREEADDDSEGFGPAMWISGVCVQLLLGLHDSQHHLAD